MAQRGHTNIDSMKDESPSSVMNNFIAGLKTEFTGLNFPLNAATDCDNVIFNMQGNVSRRKGFDFELNYSTFEADRDGKAITSFRWLNAGGDGETQIYVLQIGQYLYFYLSSNATVASPLSTQKLASIVDISTFKVSGTDLDPSGTECQYAAGNGYLFVYNPACDPFYCDYNISTQVITPHLITVKIRDFVGVPEDTDVSYRPLNLTNEHNYNLQNQGWTSGALWSTTFTSNDPFQHTGPLSFTGSGYRDISPTYGYHTWTVTAGLPIEAGTLVDISYSVPTIYYSIHDIQWFDGVETGTATGVVISYTGTTLVVNITTVDPLIWGDSFELTEGGDPDTAPFNPTPTFTYTVKASGATNTIATWNSQVGGYPSNSDIWFRFKDDTGAFSPATTIGDVGINSAPAPKGHFIVEAFNQQQSSVSNVSGITPFVTTRRPRTGSWFQGRVWYTGCDASQQATGDQNFYTWTENIYFSQVIETVDQFGHCYQTDDPTSEDLYLELPTDGGVITIQGCGAIFKLFPIQNGMLVFAANGIWFITGSQGIGFSATDYTITKISAVRSISSNSFVDVNGLPYFWNEEGIYAVEPAPQGLGLVVNPLTVGTIRSFYNKIPYESKKNARGDYNPIDYILQWVYRDPSSGEGQSDEYTFYIFDDSCHLFTSTDSGNSWLETGTPSGVDPTDATIIDNTMGDPWTDMYMAINDGDYETVALVDEAVNYGMYNGVYFDGSNGGVEIASPPTKSFTGRLINPSKIGVVDSDYQEFISTAITAKGETILIPVQWWDLTASGADSYPRLSTDYGSTWSDITNLPANTKWTVACFSKDADYIYIHQLANIWSGHPTGPHDNGGIWRSTDKGITWTFLSSSDGLFKPLSGQTAPGTSQTSLRLRCSEDGSVVAGADWFGNFWISTDYGETWTHKDFALEAGTTWNYVTAGDFGMSIDGSTIIVGISSNPNYGVNHDFGYYPYVWISNDTGSTWTLVKDKLNPPDGGTFKRPGFSTCNVAPDGIGMIVTYAYTVFQQDSGTYLGYIDVSTNGGQSWKPHVLTMTFAADTNANSGGPPGVFLSSYVIPPSSWSGFTDVTSDYEFNRVLNYNTYTKAFYPWTISEGDIAGVTAPYVHDVKFITNPGGTDAPDAIFKYVSSYPTDNTYAFTFSEATDGTYYDWDYATETTGLTYDSYFVTGYSLAGQGLRQWQPNYINVYSNNLVSTAYSVQGLWDFAAAADSNKWSTRQKIINNKDNFGVLRRRHRVNGHGYSFQLKVSSIDNNPFDILGWSAWITENAGV